MVLPEWFFADSNIYFLPIRLYKISANTERVNAIYTDRQTDDSFLKLKNRKIIMMLAVNTILNQDM
jgi:hypothetical protein